jgi:hypothetical protein
MIFQVKNNIKNFGFSYAFYMARKSEGTIKAAYLLFVANNMIKFDQAQIDAITGRY